MKSIILVAALLLCLQLTTVSAQYTVTLQEYQNANCTSLTPGSPPEDQTNIPAGACFAPATTSVSILATCNNAGSVAGNVVAFYPTSSTCNSTVGSYYQGTTSSTGCATLVMSGFQIYVQATCTYTGAAAATAVSSLVLAVLAFAALALKL